MTIDEQAREQALRYYDDSAFDLRRAFRRGYVAGARRSLRDAEIEEAAKAQFLEENVRIASPSLDLDKVWERYEYKDVYIKRVAVIARALGHEVKQ